jgi:cholesterol transport system auxiliary component
MNLPSRRWVLAGLALVPAGCSSLLAGAPAPNLYTLTPVPAGDFPSGARVSWQLLVDPPVSSAALDTERIALSRSATTVDYFADAAWTDHAPLMVQALIIQSFENSGRIASVGRDSVALRADYVLTSEMRHFEADYATGSPVVRVQLTAKLVKIPDRAIVAHQSFDATQPAAANQVPSVVDAFNAALHKALRQLVDWTLAAAR